MLPNVELAVNSSTTCIGNRPSGIPLCASLLCTLAIYPKFNSVFSSKCDTFWELFKSYVILPQTLTGLLVKCQFHSTQRKSFAYSEFCLPGIS